MKVKKMQTVAVVIPYYNGGNYIERALNSIKKQTEKPDEIIVVDDGSEDEHKKILEQLRSKYEFTSYSKENGGQGSARNFGVEKAKSDYICLLDQDDFFLNNHIHDLKSNIPEDTSMFGCVYGDLYEADGAANIVALNVSNEYSVQPKRNINEMIARDMFILPSAALISKAAYLDISGFDPQFTGYEDDDFFLRLFRKGYELKWIKKAVTVWCIHSASTSYSSKMSLSRLKYIKKLILMFPDNESRGIYYFRDLILPRFWPLIFSDLIKSKIKNTKDYGLIAEIAKEFLKLILDCNSISIKYKMKFATRIYVIIFVPFFAIKIMKK